MRHGKYKSIAKTGGQKKQTMVKRVKEDLQERPFAERWQRAYDEAVDQLARGKRKLLHALVRKDDFEKITVAQTGKFYLLSKYKEKFGCPSITKAKIVKRRWKGKKVRGIVVVSETEAGVLDHVVLSTAGSSKAVVLYNGEDALVDEDLLGAEEDLLSEMSEECP